MTVAFSVVIAAVSLFFGWIWGNSKKGFMVDKTNEIPDCIYTVVYTDKKVTVLEAISFKAETILITTEVFGGKPIRARDHVRKVSSNEETKELKLPKVLGYPPLIKVVEKIEVSEE